MGVRTEARSELCGTVVHIPVAVGSAVAAGAELVVVESMKMHYPVTAARAGTVAAVPVAVGAPVMPGDLLVVVDEAATLPPDARPAPPAPEPSRSGRADLAAVAARHHRGGDEGRPEAVAGRHRAGKRTARENIDDLCDPGTFVEYGPLTVAAQRQRRSFEELVEKTPADGVIVGVGLVDGRRTAVIAYDYTVLAGTQGLQGHRKQDRLIDVATRLRLPVVVYAEGGGGRPGDTDGLGIAGLDIPTFHGFARLSGLVPMVAIVSGRCYAGNAALAGCCDVIIATADANLGMGGPAMIEGGGLGVFAPEEIGPTAEQVDNGVVDLAVAAEAEATAVARRYLSYFAGRAPSGVAPAGPPSGAPASGASPGGPATGAPAPLCADQRRLRDLVPEDRTRVYDIRAVLETLADTGSVLELRRRFGATVITALARIDGHPIGVVANDPAQLSGAIDADGADKGARFLQLCDAFDLPVLFLCDTPGIMVGPAAERTGLVRHVSRLFVVGANLDVPTATIVLRKGYGLGSMTMAAGGFKAPLFCVAWPTGEFGGMGLEGAVRLGFRRELAAIDDPEQREQLFQTKLRALYDRGAALSAATAFEIDEVIDPADSRRWITTVLVDGGEGPARPGPPTKKRPYVDPW
ncbi:MAG TPA: carboxyl transferase domain-containing protein [Acidimicrobiia bacterium]|nr:carboxyl transferase domain-containing protein [Acidimicrobiia bacterium]